MPLIIVTCKSSEDLLQVGKSVRCYTKVVADAFTVKDGTWTLKCLVDHVDDGLLGALKELKRDHVALNVTIHI